MGWDAFGLPAENAAIERGIHPAEWTVKNIAIMKEQMNQLMLDFDWSKVNIYIRNKWIYKSYKNAYSIYIIL